jgi:hypothetical protein
MKSIAQFPLMYRSTALALLLIPTLAFAQEEVTDTLEEREIGNKEYVIVKDYKPVLAESWKISDAPEGDTSVSLVLPQTYSFESRRAGTVYDAGTIKAVKIKDEPLQKLYRAYLKAGGGNYGRYTGELYLNTLRSKTGSLGFRASHLSGSPSFKDYGNAAYSNNAAALDGRYFLDHATLDGTVNYSRNLVHYYGYDTRDTIIDKSANRQYFSDLGARFGIGSTHSDSSHIKYKGSFGYSDLTDAFGVRENEFIVEGGIAKRFKEMFTGMDVSLDFFNKSDSANQTETDLTATARNVLRFRPFIAYDREKIRFRAGVGLETEQGAETDAHFFPRLNVVVPVSNGVLHLFADVEGGVQKNNYHTVTVENPFINPAIYLKNTVRLLDANGGVTGNLSRAISFTAQVGYARFSDFQLYVNDTSRTTMFNTVYDDAGRFHLHAEIGYRAAEKLTVSYRLDQYNYEMKKQEYAWYQPNTVMTLRADYNLQDKILVKAALFGYGTRRALLIEKNVLGVKEVVQELKPYVDANLSIEYRYSKILSAFVTVNNLGFSRFQQWYGFPMERLSAVGGLTYSF